MPAAYGSLTFHRCPFLDLILFRKSEEFGRIPTKVFHTIFAAKGDLFTLILDVHRFSDASHLIAGYGANRVRRLLAALRLCGFLIGWRISSER